MIFKLEVRSFIRSFTNLVGKIFKEIGRHQLSLI